MSNLDPPPILPEVTDELKNYIICPERLPVHQYERNQEFWDPTADPKDLFYFESSPLCTTLKVQRDPFTGEILDFHEVLLRDAGATAKNSMSLSRAPAHPDEAVRGSASNFPFWPGSFPDPILTLPKIEILTSELLTIPPGFVRGLIFDKDSETLSKEDVGEAHNNLVLEEKNVIDIFKIVQEEQDSLGVWGQYKKEVEEQEQTVSGAILPEEEDLLSNEAPVLNISTVAPPSALQGGSEWVVVLDTSKPVKNFEQQIPDMAMKFPFVLDNFQKLAILQLEQHNHVFVAAHTSAGKTVVAEYAIALSQKHMTRTIYTSPIKALSNQKYRDFKRQFNDVGLITGDFQINATASCLIMTTEILRSMLYCGSDITRDLEYVIFDEVHYINDKERGHVWEQVLILLPAHVCVVLLSATVPNTVQFADWLGTTHQRKVYVVSTLQRPVPLAHFLYTGTGGGSKNNRFLILNVNQWKQGGYIQAKETIPLSKDKPRPFNEQQDKNLWIGLLDHLNKNDLLPVVAFTFSRAKCDRNAANLKSVDLTSQKEKAKIRMFFNDCVKTLKEVDRRIPQLIRMEDCLSRGIGVHHSGILPIVKEMVEMLFQNGLLKLLFATETFAMGVNMPARTVVFDSMRKHDGEQWRNLRPAEYIQMAGRAGRRGLDKEGTVILLCKNQLPTEQELKDMMLGKPSLLESQFRLTYGMVLSLLRVENLSVEGMMSRSFLEAEHKKKLIDIQRKLEEVEGKITELNSQELSGYLQPLVKFYTAANSLLICRNEILPNVMSSAKMVKFLTPGRLLLVSHKRHVNKLGILLTTVRATQPTYKVLVLSDANESISEEKEELWYKMLALASDKVFVPVGSPGHDVLIITAPDILEISTKCVGLDTTLILRDWEKRQIPRFKDDPPQQTCSHAIQELLKWSMSVNEKNESLEYVHFIKDLKINESKLYEDLKYMYKLKDKLIDHFPSAQIPNFEQHFSTVFNKKFLEDQQNFLKFKLSKESLALYPDYENRLELLRNLTYVDHNNRVQLKGRVACEIGMNELLITELVLRNVLKELQPAEVAALLSALVFRFKSRNDEENESFFDELPENLKNGIVKLKEIHREIQNMELKLEIKTDEIQDDLNFGLVYIVYDWANAKPFSEIMELTDIQEGIIVRCIQQLNDTICDVRDAARIIGDPALQNKMEEASVAIKRDIVFAASLYTQGSTSYLG